MIVIGGPTASGKSDLAVQLAKYYNCEIISSDSRQFYREMSIGTAKITTEEMDGVKHHFIDNLSVEDDYSVGQFEIEVMEFLSKYFEDNKACILVGGTGLYLKAVLEGLDSFPKVDKTVKERLNKELEEEGLSSLQERLRELDPEYFEHSDIENPRRVIRALSVIEASGNSFSSYLNKNKSKRDFNTIKVCLRPKRDLLYERINERVDEMVDEGLIEEVKSLESYRSKNSLQTVGYKEIFEFLDGRISQKEAILQIKQNTRRYAKRQTTWFNNQGEWSYFERPVYYKVKKYINSRLQ